MSPTRGDARLPHAAGRITSHANPRLSRHPRDVHIKVREPQPIQLQQALVRNMTSVGSRPEQAGVVQLSAPAAGTPHRQALRHSNHIHSSQRRQHRLARAGQIANLDIVEDDTAHTASLTGPTR